MGSRPPTTSTTVLIKNGSTSGIRSGIGCEDLIGLRHEGHRMVGIPGQHRGNRHHEAVNGIIAADIVDGDTEHLAEVNIGGTVMLNSCRGGGRKESIVLIGPHGSGDCLRCQEPEPCRAVAGGHRRSGLLQDRDHHGEFRFRRSARVGRAIKWPAPCQDRHRETLNIGGSSGKRRQGHQAGDRGAYERLQHFGSGSKGREKDILSLIRDECNHPSERFQTA